MQQWIRKQGIMGDDPPYLAVGTEVSAKYKGAFCEAKVRKVVRTVKCKVTFKQGLGTANLTDDQIRGTLRVGSVCEAKHPERKEFVEATINKIQDSSQYTVVFDDGDITTLRRTALCLKSGRHFAESETLDQLPLTHPEHFGNPVIGGRKGRRSRQAHEESSDEEDLPKKGKKKEEKEADIGKVVCVELGDKKKQKDNWFPGLVVAPTAQDTVRIRVRDEYLVRSFKDGRYFTVPKKEATEFTREIGSKVDNNTLKTAVEKALLYLDRDELPPHWDRDLLFGMNDTSGHSDSEGGLDSDSSDDEPREEKDHFVAQLYKFMDDRGTPINKGPTIGTRDVDLYKLFKVVHKLGGYNRVTNHNQWKTISHKMGFGQGSSGITNLVKQAYKKFLHSFEDFYRKLGCTMVNHPRGNRSRHRGGRSLIRDRDRATPINTLKDKEKAAAAAAAATAASTSTAASEKAEKPSESEEKKEPQSEKEEEEKPNEGKKDNEDVPKVKEPAAKVKEPAAKVKEPATKVKDLAAKMKEPATKVKDLAAKVKEPATKVKDLAAKVKESATKVKDLAAKVKEPATKVKDLAAKVKEPATKVKESAAKVKEPAVKVKEAGAKVKTKVKEAAAKVKEAGTKVKEPGAKVKKLTPKVKELAAKVKEQVKEPAAKVKEQVKEPAAKVKEQVKEPAAKVKEQVKEPAAKVKEQVKEPAAKVKEQVKEPAAKVKEQVPKDKEPVAKAKEQVKEPAAKVKEQVPKVKEPAAKVKEQVPKVKEPAVKVKEQTPKGKEQVAKVKEPKKEKGKGKGEKSESLSKEDRKVEKQKVKEETVTIKVEEEEKVNESVVEDCEDKEDRLRVRDTKKEEKSKEKAKEKDKALQVQIVEEESESIIVTEVKGKGKLKEVKVKKEERVKTIGDHLKNDDKPKGKEEKMEEKVEEEIVEVVDDERSEESKKKLDKKFDDDDDDDEKVMFQQTRCKSKEDLRCKKEGIPVRESRTPVRETERLFPPHPPKKEEEDATCIMKKRGRKRKDTDERARAEETMGQLASYIAVGVGDKLKVYYGPTHESKVTYEAKVLDIEEDSSERMYLVHYTGWNTRYDEWIKRGRIADNLSWTPSRAKRLRQQQAQLKMSKPTQGKRGRPSLSGRSQEGSSQQTPRSTTPSSVTSSSSRTKSPATRSGPSTRITRNTGDGMMTGLEFRRRTRRMSGHTDISVASETESEEYDSEPEPEVEPTLTRSRSEKRASAVEEEEPAAEESAKEEGKKSDKPFKKKLFKKKELCDVPASSLPLAVVGGEDEGEEDSGETSSTPPSVEKRRSKRTRKTLGPFLDKKDVEVKQETGTEESEEEQPKGRDFDLNQIRSELKGIEKAVKVPLDLPHLTEPGDGSDDELVILDDEPDIIDAKPEVQEEVVVLEENIVVEKTPEKVLDSSTEDIYEFKEPEPFEFEVRTKRESLLSDERTSKLPRRPIARLFDVETKTENRPRKKLVRSLLKTDARDSPPFEGDVKKRFRRSPNKKTEEVPESEKVILQVLQEVEPNCSMVVIPEPVTPQKSRPLSACEEAFDKLCESPSFRLATKPNQSSSTPPMLVLPDPEPEHSKSPELVQLNLLHDDDGEDDNEDRLVISETDDMETEIEEPLFSYPQRDHEELFPTLVSSEPSVSSVEPPLLSEEPQTVKIMEPHLLSQISSDIFSTFSSGLETTKSGDKDEVLAKTPVQNEEIGDDADLASTPQSNEDVIKLLLKDGEDDEYDPINAAIQRVIAQTMMDEDTNDIDIFGGKQGLCSSFKQEVEAKRDSASPSIPMKHMPISDFKRKLGRKPVLSKEFVESDLSDSDSSDEDQRLVIDKIDEESQPEEASNSSSILSMKLQVTEASEFDMKAFEMKVHLSDHEEDCMIEEEEEEITEVTIEVPEENSVLQIETEVQEDDERRKKEKAEDEGEGEEEREEDVGDEEETAKRQRLDSESKPCQEVASEDPPLVIPVIVKMDVDDDPKRPEPEPDPDPDPEPVIILEAPIPEVKGDEHLVLLEEPIVATVESECEEVKIEVKCEEEAESNLLGSLLCQETIPRSPTQAPEACSDEALEDKILLLEMPFASVPGSNCDPASAPAPVPVPASPTPAEQSPVLPVPETSTPPPLLGQAPSPGVSKRNSNEAAPVMDNTPPTTPDSSLSTISGSPREEHEDLSPVLDNESPKSHRDSFEIDLDSCPEGTKVDHYSEDDSLLNVEVSNSCDNRLQGLKLLPKKPCMDLDKELDAAPKKRRRSRKRSECESNKRLRHSSGRSTRNIGGASDSDDTSETSTTGCMPLTSAENTLSSRSPRPSKYNFYVELAPELDGSQRIALLQQKLQELRKTYMNVKAELACIDRRRKKLRRREREVEKATKQEVACS